MCRVCSGDHARFTNLVELDDLPVVARHFDLRLVVPRQHDSVCVVHDSAGPCFILGDLGPLLLALRRLGLLPLVARLGAQLLIELLHLDVIDELRYAILEQGTLEEAVPCVQ